MMIDTQAHQYQQEAQELLLKIKADIQETASSTGIPHLSDRVIQALSKVPRHLFVRSEDTIDAYLNTALPIGEGQTISQPFIVALMTELLNLQPTDKVLEIGTGSGYQAAILSHLAAEVYTLELFPRLAEHAKEKFQKLGYNNIHAITADGSKGWPKAAPYQKIIATAAAEMVPPALIEQLAPNGIMVIPLGLQGQGQTLTVVTKDLEGQVHTRPVLSVIFVPFIHGTLP